MVNKRLMRIIFTLVFISASVLYFADIDTVMANDTVMSVTRKIDNITPPAKGWDSSFSDTWFMWARDPSMSPENTFKLVKQSDYQEKGEEWTSVVRYFKSYGTTDFSITSDRVILVDPQYSRQIVIVAEGGDSGNVNCGALIDQGTDQNGNGYYNILAYGRQNAVQIDRYGKKYRYTTELPEGVPDGEYSLGLYYESTQNGTTTSGNKTAHALFYGEVTIVVKTSGQDSSSETENDEDWPRSVTFDADSAIKPADESDIAQTGLMGAMTSVTMTVSDKDKYYFPTDYESLGLQDGITVTRVDMYNLSIEGTPAKKSTTVTLVAPSTKAIQNPPSSAVTGGARTIRNTTTAMEYASSATAALEDWTRCSAGSTENVAPGIWYVRYAYTDDKQPSEPVTVEVVSETKEVNISMPEEAKATMVLDGESGALWQKNLTGEIIPVIINAKNGYYFPDDYPETVKSNITLKRVSESQITIYGTPTSSSVSFVLEPATKKKITPSKPSSVDGGVMKITGTTDKMEYANAEDPDKWEECKNDETPVDTAGVKYVRYYETDETNAGDIATVIVEEDTSSDSEDTPTDGFTVTIENPKNSHITIGTESESLYRQTGITGEMKSVYYYADTGYYFPSSYKISPVNGVRVVRTGSNKLTVKGTPTANTTIKLDAATIVNTQLYAVKVINGTGTNSYVAGSTVEITASDKSGQTFTGWKVNSGDVSLVNANSKTTSFVMPARAVEVEACYASGTSSNTGNTSGGGSSNSGNVIVTPVDNGSSAGDNSSTTNVTTTVITPLSNDTILNNSRVLDLSAKVSWNGSAWKLTWNKVTSADGYDVFYCEGKGTPPSTSYVQITGNASTRAYISTIGGKAVNQSKVDSFVIKAYRVVNQTKDYIGTSRVLYAAGDSNKTYTNIKKLKPSKKTVTVKKGKRKKLQTKYKKQKSAKSIISNTNGKKLNYYSSDTSIATVDAAGRVKGVAKGKCTIYILAHNGVKTSITVKVK